MGERNCIELVNDRIYIYSHWDTKDSILKVVADALRRGRARWNDRYYLNRIIFSEFIKDEVLTLTGYGIGNNSQGGEVMAMIDVESNTVNGISFEEFLEIYR